MSEAKPRDLPNPAGFVAQNEPLRRFFKNFDGFPPEEFSKAFARHSKAVERVMAREDVADVQVLADGNLSCTDMDGNVTVRAAGWRPRRG